MVLHTSQSIQIIKESVDMYLHHFRFIHRKASPLLNNKLHTISYSNHSTWHSHHFLVFLCTRVPFIINNNSHIPHNISTLLQTYIHIHIHIHMQLVVKQINYKHHHHLLTWSLSRHRLSLHSTTSSVPENVNTKTQITSTYPSIQYKLKLHNYHTVRQMPRFERSLINTSHSSSI